jgi:hypothetical protein
MLHNYFFSTAKFLLLKKRCQFRGFLFKLANHGVTDLESTNA